MELECKHYFLKNLILLILKVNLIQYFFINSFCFCLFRSICFLRFWNGVFDFSKWSKWNCGRHKHKVLRFYLYGVSVSWLVVFVQLWREWLQKYNSTCKLCIFFFKWIQLIWVKLQGTQENLHILNLNYYYYSTSYVNASRLILTRNYNW